MTDDISVLVQLINAGGVVAILVFMVVAFYRGDLLSRAMLDRILAIYENQTEQLIERVLRRIDALVDEIKEGQEK